MIKTEFSRKLDSVGRLVIPSKLRAQLNLIPGAELTFFIEEQNGNKFLCIQCPSENPEVEEAKKILRDAGFKI